MNQMKLQKLVYIALGWNLAINREPLVSGRIEAWDGGPVMRSIWNHLRDFGFNSVNGLLGNSPTDPFVANIGDSERAVIDHVWRKYGQYTGLELSDKITLDDMDNAPTETTPTGSDVVITHNNLTNALARIAEENSQLKQDLEEADKKVKTTEILDEMLKPSADKAFNYMFLYSFGVFVLILANATGSFENEIEPEVLKFLVGSTAVTVIGLVGMVLTGIFVGARK